MDAIIKTLLAQITQRGNRERDRREEWERSLKPTQYKGNNLFQEMGGNPIAGRYLGQVGLIPGQFVPNIGRNPNKPVIPGLPIPVETIEEDPIVINTTNGLFIYFDINWSELISEPFNQAFSVDLFRTSSKIMYILRGDVRIYESETFSPTVPTGDFELIEVNTIPLPSRGSTYFHPLFNFTENLTLDEFSRLKSFARTGRVIIECENTVWTTYNNNIVNGLGLSGYLHNLSQIVGLSSANLNISRSDARLNKILIDKANYPSILVNTPGYYTLNNPSNNNNAPIGIFEKSGKYAFFYVPGSFF